MNDNTILSYREVLGEGLAALRKEKNISTYAIRQKTKLNGLAIKQIENGSTAYTVDTLLQYLHAIDVYVFFADKSGKKDKRLDIDHMIKQAKKNDPKL